MKTLQEIMAAVTANKKTVAAAIATAQTTAPEGLSKPYAAQAAAETKATQAAATLTDSIEHGYAPATARFGKMKAGGQHDIYATFTVPLTVEQRVTAHKAQVMAFKARMVARQAAKKLPPVEKTPEQKQLELAVHNAKVARKAVKLAKERAALAAKLAAAAA